MFIYLWCVEECDSVFIVDERHEELSLERRLVEAGERAPGVRRLKVGRGKEVLGAGLVLRKRGHL